MVGVFVRLKLRVLRNSLRGSRLAGLLGGAAAGLILAVGGLLLGAVPFDRPGATVDVLASVYGVCLVGWVLAPLATGGGDETLRPEHFRLLPIGKTRLALGLLGASFVGVPAVLTLVAFAGLSVYGLRFGPVPAFVGALGGVLLLVLIVLVYRVVMAAMRGLLTSRKGKELGVLLLALVGLSGAAANYVLGALGPALVRGTASEFATVMRALPSGWPAVAVRAAITGRWVQAALLLLAMLAVIAALVAIWAILLARAERKPQAGRSARVRSRDSAARRSLLPRTPAGAVAAKELRTWWRDPRRRVALLSTVVLGLVITIAPELTGEQRFGTGVLPFLGVVVVAIACVQAGNLYGLDGSALWHTLVTPGAYGPDVRGRQLAWALIAAAPGLLLALVLPAATGQVSAYPWVLALVPALLGAGAGVVVLQSVFVAFPLPDPRRDSNPFNSGGRPGCSRALLLVALSLLLAVGVLPPIGLLVGGALTGQPVLSWLAMPVGAATGILLAWWWGRIAIQRLTESGQELLATVAKEP